MNHKVYVVTHGDIGPAVALCTTRAIAEAFRDTLPAAKRLHYYVQEHSVLEEAPQCVDAHLVAAEGWC